MLNLQLLNSDMFAIATGNPENPVSMKVSIFYFPTSIPCIVKSEVVPITNANEFSLQDTADVIDGWVTAQEHVHHVVNVSGNACVND